MILNDLCKASSILLLSNLSISCTTSTTGGEQAKAARPNILLIYTDDQSYRTLGCYRDEGAWPWVQTPNIDRLAAEGVRFTTCYGASWCTPSRACLLTGQYQHHIQGLPLNERRDPKLKWKVLGEPYDRDKVDFWPVELREPGYETAMVGKWHLGQDAGHGWLWDYSVVWDQNTPKGDWYNNQELSINGQEPKVVPGYSTEVYTQFADSFIREGHEKPWFMWLCYNAPHSPQIVQSQYEHLYENAKLIIPKDVFGPRPGKPSRENDYSDFYEGSDDSVFSSHYNNKTLQECILDYNRLVKSLDDGVGKLLRALEETGQLDNTLVIFTSDQGYAWGEHGYADKVAPYDANLKMPLIFRMPGKIASGKVCNEPATIVDIAPTVLGFADVKVPWEMDGLDLGGLLQNPKASADRSVLMEHFYSRFGPEADIGVTPEDDWYKNIPYWLFVRQGKYKYIRRLVPDEIEELYDMDADPGEFVNLAIDTSYAQTLNVYRKQLMDILEETKAGFIDKLSDTKQGYE